MEYRPDVLADIEVRVRAALPQWGLSPATAVTLLNLSENATYRLDDPADGRRLVLRVHRIGYRTAAEIESELAWIRALRAGGAVETPAPVAGPDGGAVRLLPGSATDPARHAVAFDFAPGKEPGHADDLVAWFRTLGAVTARMHAHVRAWPLPDGFHRQHWDFEAMFGARPIWGSWRAGFGLDASGAALLERALALIDRRTRRFGRAPGRYGLVHADLRLANLLVDDQRLTVIDFDDCGFSWLVYDFAAAVSFMEDDPLVPAMADAWVAGYRTVLPLADADVAEIPVFLMMRRILLVGWLASHHEVPIAAQLGAGYTHGTLAMAERLLGQFS
ncbi:Ser/Thr protein kinase RdoA (MazF antagonist) [Stella humosa]|uniref:Ser/Thr protein kinase RdoA (MazF antagonist) n=1 Tax=Stella humosa TaxID=94 RepID=A0A3N1KZ48_9PROT|nr:phosphotransferase [Stella humosa]ROP84069.1 Ser/Thr protein kinase RdoA (MazF antagonist) [Stella humosa]BBK33580.1 aminoglycoside phosphotransferase [Stella humosa]